ncbi:hypothetical protein DPMN_046162 [Dreissena polymorpha]|uniref:Uncharacterized protein n=1 Tax=Dreissena polymorpha TaxID=45954 RepID=A0A9D4HXZ1_DREPO|nr:hypothetical protein DPMN_046162 [Dreissena polymorpha]
MITSYTSISTASCQRQNKEDPMDLDHEDRMDLDHEDRMDLVLVAKSSKTVVGLYKSLVRDMTDSD